MTRTLQAVLEKCLRDRNSPIWALSQNGYGDRRVKARRCTCCVPLEKITGAGECWLSAMQDSTLPYTVWPSATKMVTSLTMRYRSDHALSFVFGVTTLGKAAVVTMARADSIRLRDCGMLHKILPPCFVMCCFHLLLLLTGVTRIHLSEDLYP